MCPFYKSILIYLYQFIITISGMYIQIVFISIPMIYVHWLVKGMYHEKDKTCDRHACCERKPVLMTNISNSKIAYDQVSEMGYLTLCDAISLFVLNIYRIFEWCSHTKDKPSRNLRLLVCFAVLYCINTCILVAIHDLQFDDNLPLLEKLQIKFLYPLNTLNRSESMLHQTFPYYIIAQFVTMIIIQFVCLSSPIPCDLSHLSCSEQRKIQRKVHKDVYRAFFLPVLIPLVVLCGFIMTILKQYYLENSCTLKDESIRFLYSVIINGSCLKKDESFKIEIMGIPKILLER